jgi:carbonic anhydrase/acetyltransferase-like protein (isoleucine patch superfamily)
MQCHHLRKVKDHAPLLGQHVFIDASAVVSGQVSLCDDVSVWPCVSIRGDLKPITIGARTNVQDGAVLHTTHASDFSEGKSLTIGADVTIGHNATLHACTIGDEVLVGMGAIVLDGVVVENQVLIAAGAVVTPNKVLKSGTLWAGNPAREMRILSDKEILFFKYSAAHYVKLAESHKPSTCS